MVLMLHLRFGHLGHFYPKWLLKSTTSAKSIPLDATEFDRHCKRVPWTFVYFLASAWRLSAWRWYAPWITPDLAWSELHVWDCLGGVCEGSFHCSQFPKHNLGIQTCWTETFLNGFSGLLSNAVWAPHCAYCTDRDPESGKTNPTQWRRERQEEQGVPSWDGTLRGETPFYSSPVTPIILGKTKQKHF